MSLRDRFLADPFTVEEDDREHDDTKLKQPPVTRKEMWSYYLYYNGVCISSLFCHL